MNNYNSSEITKLLQDTEVAMLKELQEILDENHIEFCLAYGSLLGCIRHKGFIPWDDDIDIYIRGRDLDKVRDILENRLSGTLEWHDYLTQKDYPFHFPKIVLKNSVLIENDLHQQKYVCGVYIDVFPLIETSNNVIIHLWEELRRFIGYSVLRFSYIEYSSKLRQFIKRIVKLVFNPHKTQEKLWKIYTAAGKHNPQYLIDSGVFWKHAMLKSEYFEQRELKQFETLKVFVPIDSDGYLSHFYGNYMHLPPENERVSNHRIFKLSIDGNRIL